MIAYMDFVEGEELGIDYMGTGILKEVEAGMALDSILVEVMAVLDKDHLHKVIGLGKAPVQDTEPFPGSYLVEASFHKPFLLGILQGQVLLDLICKTDDFFLSKREE